MGAVFWIVIPLSFIKLSIIIERSYIFSFFKESLLLKTIGSLVFFIGFYISIKTIFLYYFFSESFPFIFTPPKRLIQEGLYLNSRNPLYIGYIFILFGIGLYISSFIFLFIIIPIFILLLIIYVKLIEEPITYKLFGEKYKRYKEKVPFIWRFSHDGPKTAHLIKSIFQIILRIMLKTKFPTSYKGKENVPEYGGVIFVANHLSYADPFFFAGTIPRNVHFLTTAEVFKSPLKRLFFNLVGSIPIKRFKRDPGGIRKMLSLLKKGYAIGYFPEGQRCWTGEPSPFPQGTARLLKKLNVPIIPVSISGIYALWPRWSDKIRPAKVEVIFYEEFIIQNDWTDEEIEERLGDIIFTPNKQYKDILLSSKNLNKGITNLLWRCPICGVFDSIKTEKSDKCYCTSCDTQWKFTLDNKLKLIEPQNFTNSTKDFSEWYELIRNHTLPDIKKNIVEIKSKTCNLYLGIFPKFKKVDTGYLQIFHDKFIFIGEKKQYSWSFDSIKIFNAEGNKKIHIITRNIQIQIFLQDEGGLKWKELYTYYKNEYINSTEY